MLTMPELSNLISRKCENCGVLTVQFWMLGSLLMVETRSWDVQQTFGMLRMAWDSMDPENQFAPFLSFFAICSLFYTPPIFLFMVCQCSLCTLERIRVANLYQISPIMIIDSWFDHCANLSKSSKSNLFVSIWSFHDLIILPVV